MKNNFEQSQKKSLTYKKNVEIHNKKFVGYRRNARNVPSITHEAGSQRCWLDTLSKHNKSNNSSSSFHNIFFTQLWIPQSTTGICTRFVILNPKASTASREVYYRTVSIRRVQTVFLKRIEMLYRFLRTEFDIMIAFEYVTPWRVLQKKYSWVISSTEFTRF